MMAPPTNHPADTGRPCVLIGWELGAGLGHVGMLRPLAVALRDEGCRVVFALRETVNTQSLLGSQGFDVLQGPVWTAPSNAPQVSLKTLGDVLFAAGYCDAERVQRQTEAWMRIVREVDPQLVIGEYSPGLALGVIGTRPYITVGSGFTVLPQTSPIPPFRYWESEVSAESLQHEAAVQTTIDGVRSRLGMAPIGPWSGLFGGDFVGVCTYPVLDNYRSYRKPRALGPLSEGPVRLSSGADRRGVFAYLSGLTKDFETMARGIASGGEPVQAYVRDIQPGQADLLRSLGVNLHASPQDLRAKLPHCAVLVHHGGLSTTHTAIETATPQIVLPTVTEQSITGRRLVELGVGLGLAIRQRTEDTVATALRRVASTPSFPARARLLHENACRHTGPSALQQLMAGCNQSLQAARTAA